jgi:hypothetical protein
MADSDISRARTKGCLRESKKELIRLARLRGVVLPLVLPSVSLSGLRVGRLLRGSFRCEGEGDIGAQFLELLDGFHAVLYVARCEAGV